MRVDEGLDEFEEAPPTHPVLCALDELEARPQWVAWKYEERNGRTTKPPINPHRGGYADSTNPKTWGTHVQAVAAAQERRLAGVGYVLSGDDDFVGYDLDKCRNPQTGWIKPWAREILSYAETYAEVSPSGTGIRWSCAESWPTPSSTTLPRSRCTAKSVTSPSPAGALRAHLTQSAPRPVTGFFAILTEWSRAELRAPAKDAGKPIASDNREADHDR